MSPLSDVYFGDRLIAGAATIAVIVSFTSALSLIVATFFRRYATLQHTILVSGLISCLGTPIIMAAFRGSGTSTLSLFVPAALGSEFSDADVQGSDASITTWLSSYFAEAPQPEGPSNSNAASILPKAGSTAAEGELSPESAQATIQVAVSDPASNRRGIKHWLSLGIIAWWIGSAVLLARMAWNSFRVARIVRSSVPLQVSSWAAIQNAVRRRLGHEQLPEIRESDRIQSPVATGVLHGKIILPTGLGAKITTVQLCDVLTHECAHIFRRDPLMLYLQAFAGCLYWPIPFVHWLNRQLSHACEEICDSIVLDRTDPLDYAETLVQIATIGGRPSWSVGTIGILHWRGSLESRIAKLIDTRRSKMTRTPRLAAIVCLAGFLLSTAAICGITIRPARAVPPAEEGSDDDSVAEAAEDTPDVTLPIRVRIMWGISGPIRDSFESQVQRFNESQPRIVVEVLPCSGYEAVHQELMNPTAGEDLPAAGIVEIHSIASLAAAKKIQPLDALIKQDRNFRPKDILPGILTNLRYREALFALPINRSTPILYYNKDRFVEAGLDPEKPPETWQEVQEVARKLTSTDKDQYGFLAASFPWIFESLVWSSGGQLIEGKRATFSEAGAKPLQLWADMVHRDESAVYGERYSALNEFPRGHVAMAIESTAVLQMIIDSSVDFKVGTAPLPHFEGYATAVPTGGGAAVIPTGISAKQKAAVWTFLTWFISTQQAAEWSRQTGYIPVRESARTLLQTEGFYDEHPEFETAIEEMKYAREAPQVAQWLSSWPTLTEAMTSILRDDEPALKTLEDAENDVTKLLRSKPE